MKKNIISIILITLVCLIYLILILQVINTQKIALGVKVNGFNLNELENQWSQFIQQELTFTYQDKTWLINLSDLGFQLDYQANINQAYYISHGSNFFVNSKNQLAALFNLINLSPAYQINQEIFQNKTNQLFKDIEGLAQNATLIFNQEINDYSLQHSTQGIVVDRQQILNQLSKQIKDFSLKAITLNIIEDKPEVENNEVTIAKEEAQRILANQPYYLTFEEEKYTINKEILTDWIIFEPIQENNSDNLILGFNLDFQKVKKYLDKVALNVDQPMTNAQLETQDNKAILFIPDQPGFEVKRDLTFDNLVKNLLSNPPIKTTPIIADKALPKIRLRQTNQLGIQDIIGQGVSNFTGSPANRKHNIKTAVAKLNGYILSPNEEFSFINFLGETGPEQGYLAELVIKDKKTIPEYGGGACQVSTTFFRAAINSGLKITERQNHSFPVVYYNPQGFDATVYDPKPDLRFINNTPDHLLIQTYVQGNQVFVNFYATDDHRKVNIKGPYILESNEDGSMKAILTQEVYKLSGEELEKQIFYSNYKSPNLFPVETGQKAENSE
ncbi:VanW family protein [Patescibacteria group bacterium]|nr:VanW family protein [Patescibacteria group bacterium]MBU1563707.1 VanW family protein [Patescibacteria group bacterium]